MYERMLLTNISSRSNSAPPSGSSSLIQPSLLQASRLQSSLLQASLLQIAGLTDGEHPVFGKLVLTRRRPLWFGCSTWSSSRVNLRQPLVWSGRFEVLEQGCCSEPGLVGVAVVVAGRGGVAGAALGAVAAD